jgi:hypothetical protein
MRKEWKTGGHCWQEVSYLKTHQHPQMNATQRTVIMQRWNVMQHNLIPELKEEVGVLMPKLEKVIHTLDWV